MLVGLLVFLAIYVPVTLRMEPEVSRPRLALTVVVAVATWVAVWLIFRLVDVPWWGSLLFVCAIVALLLAFAPSRRQRRRM